MLLEVAECVDEDPLLFMVSLRYRRLAAERGAGPENDAVIEAHEDRRAKIQDDLYRKPPPPAAEPWEWGDHAREGRMMIGLMNSGQL